MSLGFALGLPQLRNSVSQHLNSKAQGKRIPLAQTRICFGSWLKCPLQFPVAKVSAGALTGHDHSEQPPRAGGGECSLPAVGKGLGGADASECGRIAVFAVGRALLAFSSRISVVITSFSHPRRTKGCQAQCFVAKHLKPTIAISRKFLNTVLKNLKAASLRLHGLEAQP